MTSLPKRALLVAATVALVAPRLYGQYEDLIRDSLVPVVRWQSLAACDHSLAGVTPQGTRYQLDTNGVAIVIPPGFTPDSTDPPTRWKAADGSTYWTWTHPARVPVPGVNLSLFADWAMQVSSREKHMTGGSHGFHVRNRCRLDHGSFRAILSEGEHVRWGVAKPDYGYVLGIPLPTGEWLLVGASTDSQSRLAQLLPTLLDVVTTGAP